MCVDCLLQSFDAILAQLVCPFADLVGLAEFRDVGAQLGAELAFIVAQIGPFVHARPTTVR